MADQPSPRRRFQFRLRTLMIVVALLAFACGYVGWQMKIVRDRKEFLLTHAHILSADEGPTVRTPQAPAILRLFGAESVFTIDVYGTDDLERAASLFPEATVADVKDRQQFPPP